MFDVSGRHTYTRGRKLIKFAMRNHEREQNHVGVTGMEREWKSFVYREAHAGSSTRQGLCCGVCVCKCVCVCVCVGVCVCVFDGVWRSFANEAGE